MTRTINNNVQRNERPPPRAAQLNPEHKLNLFRELFSNSLSLFLFLTFDLSPSLEKNSLFDFHFERLTVLSNNRIFWGNGK